MKILITGQYKSDYNRTFIIIKGFKELGHEVIEFPIEKKDKETASRIETLSKGCDFVFLPSFTHKEVEFVKKYSQSLVIFDPLVSKWMTNVLDYKQFSRFGLKAWRDFRLDKKTFQLADILLSDTDTHADWLSEKFKIPRSKFKTVYIGADLDEFHAISRRENSAFKVGFYGGFIPLQGALNIIEAINLFKNSNFQFELIGTGFEYEKAKKLIKKYDLNVSLPGWVDYNELGSMINSYDVCLGIFGDTLKADLVIPNKVYHYAACGVSIISKRTPAMLEIFEDRKNIIFSSSEPQDIASKIKLLHDNPALRTEIGNNARKLMEEKFNCVHVASRIIEIFKNYQA